MLANIRSVHYCIKWNRIFYLIWRRCMLKLPEACDMELMIASVIRNEGEKTQIIPNTWFIPLWHCSSTETISDQCDFVDSIYFSQSLHHGVGDFHNLMLDIPKWDFLYYLFTPQIFGICLPKLTVMWALLQGCLAGSVQEAFGQHSQAGGVILGWSSAGLRVGFDDPCGSCPTQDILAVKFSLIFNPSLLFVSAESDCLTRMPTLGQWQKCFKSIFIYLTKEKSSP